MEDVLDINQLALRLGDTVDTIEKNMKRNPVQVPPRMYVRGNAALLRWRLDTVEAWVRGREAGRSSPRGVGQRPPTLRDVVKLGSTYAQAAVQYQEST